MGRLFLLFLWGVCVSVSLAGFDGRYLIIGNPAGGNQKTAPYFFAKLDAAGYSDAIYYGPSDIHDQTHNVYGYHELLSGEWAAAVYYDGINTSPTIDPNDPPDRRQAMWLTKMFEFPYWPTYCDFVFGGTCAEWANPNNPTPLDDTGRSIIRNNEVEITIDYEVVDLEPLGSIYSPMTFIKDPNTGSIGYIYSDRYIFLQTYTFRNLKNESLTNLEFYQFLHSHGADEYDARVSSTYSDISVSDPLASYSPRNPVHSVGNFRYDITQWNSPPFGRATHIDYVSFSSTQKPDFVDNDLYKGHGGKPNEGTHIHIEDRMLNNTAAVYNDEVGGAMGWNLGSLDPNETTSITVAFMFAPKQDSPLLILNKTDDVDEGDCVGPGEQLTYTISWQNIGITDAEDAVLVDYLPAGVTYPQGLGSLDPNFVYIPGDPGYNIEAHTYTWYIGTIEANSSGSVQLTVTVNEKAEPGMKMRNTAVLTTSIGDATAQWDTNICCRGGDIIYVDSRAAGTNIGTSWQDAYTDLQRALTRAVAGCGNEIWVAFGSYDPGRNKDTTLGISTDVSVYGGFAGNETQRDQRNPKVYKTTLTGGADTDRNETVVTMGNNTLLDGVTVRDSSASPAGYGIYGKDVDFTVFNCSIEDNLQYGIYADNGNVSIKWCSLKNNGYDGIRHIGFGKSITIENCQIYDNLRHGLFLKDSVSDVKNNVVWRNGESKINYKGIWIENPKTTPAVYNNTIAHNFNEAILYSDGDPNQVNRPDIRNCIIYYNNANVEGKRQMVNIWSSQIHFSCLQDDPNDPTGLDDVADGNGNISCLPGFAYDGEPNNVHLAYDSPYKDKGNTSLSYTGQVDLDGQDRVYNNTVDIGADEVTCEDVYNSLDWNADGLVNMNEFYYCAKAWLSHDPNDPVFDPNSASYNPNVFDPNHADYISPEQKAAWNPICNLDATGESTYIIDLADLLEWLDDDWLWVACWKQAQMQSAFGGMLMSQFAPETSLQTESFLVDSIANKTTVQLLPQKTVQQQIVDLQETAQFLEKLWLEDELLQKAIDAEDWQKFMDKVYKGLSELQSIKTKTLDMKEDLQ